MIEGGIDLEQYLPRTGDSGSSPSLISRWKLEQLSLEVQALRSKWDRVRVTLSAEVYRNNKLDQSNKMLST